MDKKRRKSDMNISTSSIMLDDAYALAFDAHKEQKDKCGEPYVKHCLNVKNNLPDNATEDMKIVALLHDVVEDTEITLEQLEEWGYNSFILEALNLLNKKRERGLTWAEYIRIIRENPIAREVKKADLLNNMDLQRYARTGVNITEKEIERNEKYLKAYKYLIT